MQAGLFDEPDSELDAELKDQLDDLIDIQSYKRKKHPVRRSIPDTPREVIIHNISDEEKICRCGSELISIEEEISEQINLYLKP